MNIKADSFNGPLIKTIKLTRNKTIIIAKELAKKALISVKLNIDLNSLPLNLKTKNIKTLPQIHHRVIPNKI